MGAKIEKSCKEVRCYLRIHGQNRKWSFRGHPPKASSLEMAASLDPGWSISSGTAVTVGEPVPVPARPVV